MKNSKAILVGLFLVLCNAGFTQTSKKVQFGIQGGLSIPLGQLGKYNAQGFGAGAYVAVKLTEKELRILALFNIVRFIGDKVDRGSVGGEPIPTLQNTRILHLGIGLIQKVKKFEAGATVGYATANRRTTDVVYTGYIALQPFVSYAIQKNIAVYSAVHLGATKADDFTHLSLGIKFIF